VVNVHSITTSPTHFVSERCICLVGSEAMTEHQATTAQQSSREWLKVRGLQALQLTMDQILPTLGFKQSRGVVPALPHTVPSLYAEGLFTQHPNSSGLVYNVNNWCMQT